jgi:hypothetical protein
MTERIYQTEEIKDLFAALVKVQAGLKHAKKKEDNPFYKSKYAGLPEVIDASRKLLTDNGLAISQSTDYETVDLRPVLITQLTHSSGQWIRGYYPIISTKQDPQALGSALTYARRYAYMAIIGLAAEDEDDDGNAASGIKAKLPELSTENFSKNKEKWKESIKKGKSTGDLISILSTKYTVTDKHIEEIKSWQA